MNTTERIFDLITKRKINAKTLSLATGISTGNISDWKNKKANPSYGAIVKIAKYFNVSPEYLECKTDDSSPPNKKDLPENENQEGQAIYDALVEIGAINKDDEITDKQVDALLEYFVNNKDYIRFLLDKNK